MSRPISVVFFGTPSYAEPALRMLTDDARFDVRLVVTQPDRPGGRGHHLIEPPIKRVAVELGLPVFQPTSLRGQTDRDVLGAQTADVFVVAAYGLIFGRKTLALPTHGCLNLHASILPAYRGAAPIPAAILNGDAETGVTLMEMEVGLDTGPIVDIVRTPIRDDDTTATLTDRLGRLGGELVVESLPAWLDGELVALPQPEGATAVRMLTKADGGLDWSRPAPEIERRVRAMWPWPRVWTSLAGTVVQIHRASHVSPDEGEPGVVAVDGQRVIVGTGTGSLRLDTIQLPGGRPVSGIDAVKAGYLRPGQAFSSAEPNEPPLIRRV